MNRIKMLVAVCAGVLAVSAQAAWNGSGSQMKAFYPSDAGCIRTNSYAAVINTCSYAVYVNATLPVASEGWYNTSVSLFGSNSWCQSVSTNGVGNGANIGANTWTVAGPQTWQTLNTGSRYVWSWSPVLFWCLLEPTGQVGSFTAG
jgi:hypothetical protein